MPRASARILRLSIFSAQGKRNAVFQMTVLLAANDIVFLTDCNISDLLTREKKLFFSS
jgi:hypothetical protein